MIRSFSEMIKAVKGNRKMILSIAGAHDDEVLMAMDEARRSELIEPILVGDIPKIKELSSKLEISLEGIELVNADSDEECGKIAVSLVSSGKADFLMKGIIKTADIMKPVLDKEQGLRTESLLSHVMIYEVPGYDRLILLSDGGMNIAPSKEEKVKICENTAIVAKALGNQKPKLAMLAAVEVVNPKMQATIDADFVKNELSEADYIVDGPVALDLAVSEEACQHKGYNGKIMGDADALIVPNIEMGNGIGKGMTYFAKAKPAGIVMGAKVPVVLVSRADSHESKLLSIALGSLIASK